MEGEEGWFGVKGSSPGGLGAVVYNEGTVDLETRPQVPGWLLGDVQRCRRCTIGTHKKNDMEKNCMKSKKLVKDNFIYPNLNPIPQIWLRVPG